MWSTEVVLCQMVPRRWWNVEVLHGTCSPGLHTILDATTKACLDQAVAGHQPSVYREIVACSRPVHPTDTASGHC